MKPALVLLSGGLDSAVTLWWARRQGKEVIPLSFHYRGRPRAEVVAARRLTEALRTKPIVHVELPFLMDKEDLTKRGLGDGLLADAPLAYIPARNLVFYAIAAYHAESTGADWIVGGHNGGDGETFPDATEEFFRAFPPLYRAGLWSARSAPPEIVLPLHRLAKADVVRLGQQFGVPFEATWSCYWDKEAHCRRCPSCEERRQAFAAAGVSDPIAYLEGEPSP